jgi:hypothetical protein
VPVPKESRMVLAGASEHWGAVQVRPGLTSWVILSRPFGTDFVGNGHPALRAGLLSAVPSGLVPIHAGS